MRTMYGLNFAPEGNTQDGTGFKPKDLANFLAGTAKELNKKLTIGVCMYTGIEPLHYEPFCEMIRSAGHEVLLRPIDSYDMAHYSVDGYRRRYESAINSLHGNFDYIECANEVNGSRSDYKWPGPKAAEKMFQALDVCEGLKRVVTFYYNNDDPQYVYEWIKHIWDGRASQPQIPEIVFMSNYILSTPGVAPTPLKEIIDAMTIYFPKCRVGFGEYGSEDENGNQGNSTHVANMVSIFEERDYSNAKDIGGNFFWDAYHWLVENPTKAVSDALIKGFSK